MKKTLEEVNKEIADLESQRANLFNSYQEKKQLLVDKSAEQKTAVRSGNDTSDIIAEILKTKQDIQGLFGVIKDIDEDLEKLRKTQGIEFQWVALAQAEKLGSEALDVLKPVYETLVEFVERSGQAMDKAKELDEKLRKVKRPTPMTNLSQRLSGLFYDVEKELPLILERFPKEMFEDGKLPNPIDLKKRLSTSLKRRNTIR